MTAAVARHNHADPAPRRSPAERPDLRVLDQDAIRRRSRRRIAMVALFVIVVNAFFAVAFVHAQLVAGQHELDLIRTQITELETEKARIERAVDEASSPSLINEHARLKLGMVRAESPVYLAAVGGFGQG